MERLDRIELRIPQRDDEGNVTEMTVVATNIYRENDQILIPLAAVNEATTPNPRWKGALHALKEEGVFVNGITEINGVDYVNLIDFLDPQFRLEMDKKFPKRPSRRDMSVQLDTQLFPLFCLLAREDPDGARALGINPACVGDAPDAEQQDYEEKLTASHNRENAALARVRAIEKLMAELWAVVTEQILRKAEMVVEYNIPVEREPELRVETGGATGLRERLMLLLASNTSNYNEETAKGILYEEFGLRNQVSLIREMANRGTNSRLDTVEAMGMLSDLYETAVTLFAPTAADKAAMQKAQELADTAGVHVPVWDADDGDDDDDDDGK